jgi:hypothetical protein
VNFWAGVLNGVTSFVAAFASPLWGGVADRHGRKLTVASASTGHYRKLALIRAAQNGRSRNGPGIRDVDSNKRIVHCRNGCTMNDMIQRNFITLLVRIRPAPLGSLLKRALRIDRTVIDTPHGSFWVDPVSNLGTQVSRHRSYESGMQKTLEKFLRALSI